MKRFMFSDITHRIFFNTQYMKYKVFIRFVLNLMRIIYCYRLNLKNAFTLPQVKMA